VCLVAKSKGKPDAGNPLVRFDEGEGNALPTLLAKKYRNPVVSVCSGYRIRSGMTNSDFLRFHQLGC